MSALPPITDAGQHIQVSIWPSVYKMTPIPIANARKHVTSKDLPLIAPHFNMKRAPTSPARGDSKSRHQFITSPLTPTREVPKFQARTLNRLGFASVTQARRQDRR